MALSQHRLLYRIIASDAPSAWDFTSGAARGQTLREPTPEALRLWSGVSVYDSAERARRLARRRPELGRFVAVLRVPIDANVPIERTGNRPGHHTIWAEPAVLLSWVVGVEAA